MGLYEGLKDAVSLVQKADNIELYQKLIDLSKQAVDIQNENDKLNQENKKLKSIEEIEKRIIRYDDKAVISLKDDQYNLLYCSICWDKDKNLIQVPKDENGRFYCRVCQNSGVYNKQMWQRETSNNHSGGFNII